MGEIADIYAGSDGTLTRALYEKLAALGPAGQVAVNLFRACKCSERAKRYRGQSYRGAAYDRKQWSMNNLAKILIEHAAALSIRWGWKIDPSQPVHCWVLYVVLPEHGMVSFHTGARGPGPDFDGDWDGQRNVGHLRTIAFCESLFEQPASPRVDALDQTKGTQTKEPA